MADDLDDFLKQAALRRQQRQQQRGNREPAVKSKQPPQSQSSPRSEPPRLQQQQDPNAVAPVLEPTQPYPTSQPYQPTLGNLSRGLPSASPSDGVDQADERMQSHIKEAFHHEIGSLRPVESKPSNKRKGKKEPQRLQETPATPAEAQPTAKVSSASLAAQLRDPQSLRMAIIAHEIMKRPWQ